jgi:hypothetical protein
MEVKEKIKKLNAREKAKASALKFKKEFNKALSTALLGAFGFIIALSWRDLITEYINEISQTSPVKGKLISALIVTLVSVIGIIIVTSLLNEKVNPPSS